MKRSSVWLLTFALAGCLTGCIRMAQVPLEEDDLRIAQQLGLEEETLGHLMYKPIYRMKPKEVDWYLAYLHEKEPDLQKRIVHLGRKNLGQPYQIYLLGEFPYELYDSQPLYELRKSDCVVFSEHTYAMALSSNWREFFRTLQRIRYKDGEIGMLTRNHYTIADWDRNNRWLMEDVTREVGGEQSAPLHQVVNRAKFFSKHGIGQDIPKEEVADWYVPREVILKTMDRLQDGDFVNVIRGNEKSQYAGHTGLITKGPGGETYFLHSTPPKVREELLAEYLERTQERTLGMKFLRPRFEELKNFSIFAKE